MIRVITTIDPDLYGYLAERAGVERRSLREMASWFLEAKLTEDKAQQRAPEPRQPQEGEPRPRTVCGRLYLPPS